MPLPIFLDSNALSRILHPLRDEDPLSAAVARLLEDGRFRVFVPEIIDYEVRRKLLHLTRRPHQARKWARDALQTLDQLVTLGYFPLSTETLRLAALLWAESRARGRSRGTEESLDVDVILAAQARVAGAHIVTTNERHFQGIAQVFDWRAL